MIFSLKKIIRKNNKYTEIEKPKTKNITLWNPRHEET